MSKTYHYPNGDTSVTVRDCANARQRHFLAAFSHVWDMAPWPRRNNEYTYLVMRAQAYQWWRAFEASK
jgi:hypothetical protein